MSPGTSVRMSEALKARLRGKCGEAGKHLGPFDPGGGTPEDPGGDCWGCAMDHVEEFGACVGIVEGPVLLDEGAPEVNVRWKPSNLRYGYDPADLAVVGGAP
jgi:hypothetical protein